MGITNRHHHKFLATRRKSNPLPSMYGKFTYIYHKNQPNVCKYSLHGSYGWIRAPCHEYRAPVTPTNEDTNITHRTCSPIRLQHPKPARYISQRWRASPGTLPKDTATLENAQQNSLGSCLPALPSVIIILKLKIAAASANSASRSGLPSKRQSRHGPRRPARAVDDTQRDQKIDLHATERAEARALRHARSACLHRRYLTWRGKRNKLAWIVFAVRGNREMASVSHLELFPKVNHSQSLPANLAKDTWETFHMYDTNYMSQQVTNDNNDDLWRVLFSCHSRHPTSTTVALSVNMAVGSKGKNEKRCPT